MQQSNILLITLATLEDDVNRMMMYIAKKRDEKAVMTAGLLLDQMQRKEFENLNTVSTYDLNLLLIIHDISRARYLI